MTLQLGPKLALPDDAVTQTFAILAKRGAGKSNTAAVMAEEMFAAGLPFVVVDPVGQWWGLRSSSDGTPGGGLQIPIFGGKHGDVPLEQGGGNLMADLVVDERLTCVLDISNFDSEAAKKRFLLDFARRLYQRNEAPLHLILEEADDYIPQRPMRDEAQLLRAFENIVRRGRARGLGITLISQRSAALNKNVLTQADTLIALRTTGPQDRAAIEEWVKYHGARQDVLSTLATLGDGEAWVWSPSWLEVMERVKIRRRRTFDSGATPKTARTQRAPATLASIDLEAIAGRMAETIERAKETDPKELQKRVRELERQQKQLESQKVAQEIAVERVEVPVEVRVEIPVFPEETLARIEALVEKASGPLTDLLSEAQELAGVAKHGRERLYELLDQAKTSAAPAVSPKTPNPKAAGAVGPSRKLLPTPAAPAPSFAEEVKLRKGARRMLEVLARMADLGPLTRQQLGTLAGLSARGGTFSDYLSSLRRGGYIVDAGEHVQITEIGVKFAGDVAGPVTTEELVGLWQGALKAGARRMLDVLVEAYPSEMTRQELAEASGVVSSGGTFSDYLSSLRRNGLLDESGGSVRANPSLFMGDAA